MSAIFGMVYWHGESVSADDLARMDHALAAHGADGGIWARANVGLGQRLRRFTPEDACERQPLVSADGQRVLVSDGRIDNRAELIAALRAANPQAALARPAAEIADGELFLRAYETWGEACPAHLVGEFVFAVWDAAAQRLLIAQPRLGQRSLVYRATPRLFAFATMSSALLALPGVPREINLESIADYLTLAPREPGSSFHRGIQRLDQSHLLRVQRAGVTVRQHWQPDLRRELRLPHDEDYVAAFIELFERVVEAQLRSATPVGLMMSGGLDSTAVAALAAPLLAHTGQRLATFTEVPRANFDGAISEGKYADETPFVQAMARRYENLDLNLAHTDGQFYLDGLKDFFAVAEAPFRNAANRPWYEAILRMAQQQNVRVMLDGGAGNLTISWNGSGLLPQLLRAGKVWRAWREAGRWRTFVGQGILPLLPAPLWLAAQRIRRGDDPRARVAAPWRAYSVIRPEFAQEQRLEERARAAGHEWRPRGSSDTRGARAAVLTHGPNGAADIATGYRAWFGVDQRGPTGDLRLFEFCLSLPEEQYLRAGQSRWLIRRAMAGRLPAEILTNKRRGLQAADWFERLNQARPAVLAELAQLEQSDLARQALDLARMRDLVERMAQPRGDARRVMTDYRTALDLGLMTGRFLRWLETGA